MSLPEQWSDCFWSYVRSDNDNLRGRIDHMRQDLAAQYSLETGEELRIFVDGEDIGWGQDWQETLDIGVGRTAFFIPIVTPNYTKSTSCRDEILKFNAVCQARGVKELILPIVVANPERISKDDPDEVIRIIAAAIYEPFHEVIRCGRDSQQWMEGIHRLVQRLIHAQRRVEEKLPQILSGEIVRAVETVVTDPAAHDLDSDEVTDSPGMLELVEKLTPSLESTAVTLQKAVADFTVVSQLMAEHGERVGEQGNDPVAYKAAILTMAEELGEPARKLEASASGAQRDITETDQLIREIKDVLDRAVQSPLLDEIRASFAASLNGVGEIDGVAQLMDDLARQIATAESISLILKRSLRPARRAVLMLRDSARMAASWRTVIPPESLPPATQVPQPQPPGS
ncbi:hypothetical protein GCM10027445_49660 [Amycolatopsis endophytica]|uniref:TIR domain-containing protein n=1 Tax=Amycolatopsis endophytica TaxID=860233 RepID=A0A853B2Q5_9PSEU|nr:toll/interleukin-1 receptor domain-containing protein [Amycolatopsis endophytica]NYI89105.1 hypothetical protein [Amycolatopsis endophytica]